MRPGSASKFAATMAGNSVGKTLAKILGINVDYRKEEPLVSGAASTASVDTCESGEQHPPVVHC